MKNILYINCYGSDFLADSFLIGLKMLEKEYNFVVHEYPLNNYIYKDSDFKDADIHGIGFTLSNIIDPNLKINYRNQLKPFEYDLYIFGTIHRVFHYYLKLFPFLTSQNTIIIDAEDDGAPLGYNGYFWRKPYLWFLPKPHKLFPYYKREFIKEEILYWRYYKLIPRFLCKYLPLNKNFRTISYSFPEEKITSKLDNKIKLFCKHIVDEEVAENVEGSYVKYAFDNEEDYYADLQSSKYGITTKRGGWDCLRHYEIAGNGAVICFKNLHLKPETCAPHGLIPGTNCLSYTNFANLISQIEIIEEDKYQELQQKSMEWINIKTCKKVVSNVLKKHEIQKSY